MTTKIDNTNYELWLLRYAEGDLGADERAAVEAWLAGHPEAAAELSLYREAPRLERDQSVRYVATPLQPTTPQPTAPRLERDQSVRYVATPLQPTAPQPAALRPLWPLLARWSAAAAVIAALMLPALRMGGLAPLPPQEEAPQLLAEATPPTAVKEQAKTPTTKKNPGKLKRLEKLERLEILEKPERLENPSPQEAKDSLMSVPPHPSIPSTNLIALEEETLEADVWPSLSLIDYDHSVDWGDLLLAANDTFRESIAKVKNRLQQ